MTWIYKLASAIVAGLIKPLLDAWQLSKQINARITEKARADTAESASAGDIAATKNEADLRAAREAAEKQDTGLDSW